MKYDLKTAVWDMDYIRYSCGFASEKRDILVVHKKTGEEIVCKSRTEFYGRSKKKIGGLLEQIMLDRDEQYTIDDFEIFDRQHPEPIENCLHLAKVKVESVMKHLGISKLVGYHGAGDSFRVERSTVIKYKAQRENVLKPVYIDEITEYIVKKWNSIPCEYWEADDMCVMEAYRKPDHIVITHDKDVLGCPVLSFNPTKIDNGIADGNCFGSLWIEGDKSNKKVRGIGRKFFYQQVASLDAVDNYRANAASDKAWAEFSAFEKLKDCQNDVECFQALKEIYQYLYPSPVIVNGWRGEPIRIDWKYMLNEVWDMARMYRHKDDNITAEDVFKKYNLWET